MGVLHPSGMFFFEITIIFVVANKIFTIYRATGVFSRHHHHLPSRKRACALVFDGGCSSPTPPPPTPCKMRAVAPFQHQHSLHPQKTSHVCSFLRVLAPANTNPLPRNEHTHSFSRVGGSSLLPPAPPPPPPSTLGKDSERVWSVSTVIALCRHHHYPPAAKTHYNF